VRRVIEAIDLTRRFGDRVAVEGLSFQVRAGEIFALVGPNGAGKTTTLRMLGGLIAPSSGSARIAGIPLSRGHMSAVRGKVGFLTEAPGLWDRLTVRSNLLVYARLYGVPEPRRAVDRVLELFGLTDRASSLAAPLSKGMKQRVALARSWIHDPPVMLLDEPTSGLDPQTARAVRDLIVDRRRGGCAVIVSTHNLDEAERLADHVGVLQRRLLAVDAPDALRRRLFGRRVRFRVSPDGDRLGTVALTTGATDLQVHPDGFSVALDDSATDVPRLVRALVEAGADIHAVVPDRVPLEDVYVRLIEEEKEAGNG
jgi:ABC-2 type transport system ATP-binding protein